MRHALIVGDDDFAARTVETRLSAAGFTFTMHAHTLEEARVAARRKPQVVVVLAEAAPPTDLLALYEISEEAEAPILIATSDPERATDCLGPGAALDGPYPLEARARSAPELAAVA